MRVKTIRRPRRKVPGFADSGRFPGGKTSHFALRDPEHSHDEKFYLFQDQTEEAVVVAPDVMPLNGHCTCLPGNKWILNDTCPDDHRTQLYFIEISGIVEA